LSKLDDRQQSNDVISILHDGGANLLPVSGLAMPNILRRTKTISIPNVDQIPQSTA